MAYEQIIKALECCINNDCDNCPLDYKSHFKNCLEGFLDLINRQKAEIDALIAGQETLQRCIAEKDAEIEQQENYAFAERDMAAELYEELKTAKSEAIKEFAGRLKKQFKIQSHYQTTTIIACAHFKDAIDNLVEEMVGETDV